MHVHVEVNIKGRGQNVLNVRKIVLTELSIAHECHNVYITSSKSQPIDFTGRFHENRLIRTRETSLQNTRQLQTNFSSSLLRIGGGRCSRGLEGDEKWNSLRVTTEHVSVLAVTLQK